MASFKYTHDFPVSRVSATGSQDGAPPPSARPPSARHAINVENHARELAARNDGNSHRDRSPPSGDRSRGGYGGYRDDRRGDRADEQSVDPRGKRHVVERDRDLNGKRRVDKQSVTPQGKRRAVERDNRFHRQYVDSNGAGPADTEQCFTLERAAQMLVNMRASSYSHRPYPPRLDRRGPHQRDAHYPRYPIPWAGVLQGSKARTYTPDGGAMRRGRGLNFLHVDEPIPPPKMAPIEEDVTPTPSPMQSPIILSDVRTEAQGHRRQRSTGSANSCPVCAHRPTYEGGNLGCRHCN